jgi:hypothetical protein
MRPAVRFGIGIIVLALVTAIIVTTYFLLNYGSINLTMLVLPAVGVIFGIGLIIGGFGTALAIEDEMEHFEQLVGDDIQHLISGYITYTHVKLAAVIVAIITEAYLLFKFQKWTATWWGGVPVVIIAVVCIGAILYGGLTMNWFQKRVRRTYWWVFALFFVGWICSAYIGTYNTEPIEFNAWSRLERQDYNYAWNLTRAGQSGYFHSSSGSSSSFVPDISLPSCDGDACGAVVLFIVIVIVVVVCIAASAFIPHFWVVATCMLLTAMALVTLREWLVVESSSESEKAKIESSE